jgi:hypothetical protein
MKAGVGAGSNTHGSASGNAGFGGNGGAGGQRNKIF